MRSLSSVQEIKAIELLDKVPNLRQEIIDKAMLGEEDKELRKRWENLLGHCDQEELDYLKELVQSSIHPLEKYPLSKELRQSLAEDSELAIIGEHFRAHQPTSLARQLFERIAYLFQTKPGEDSWQALDDLVCMIQDAISFQILLEKSPRNLKE